MKDHPVILNFTGKEFRMILNGKKMKLSGKELILPPLGSASIVCEGLDEPNCFFHAVSMNVKGLPPQSHNVTYLVSEDIARLLSGMRHDLCYPYLIESEDERTILCNDIAKIYPSDIL